MAKGLRKAGEFCWFNMLAPGSGTVCVPPRDIPQVGRFAGIVSPASVVFHAIRYARP